MSNTIPPLVCNTPPPIDDFDHDDEFGREANESNFDHYDDDQSLPSTPQSKSTTKSRLTPVEMPVPDDVDEQISVSFTTTSILAFPASENIKSEIEQQIKNVDEAVCTPSKIADEEITPENKNSETRQNDVTNELNAYNEQTIKHDLDVDIKVIISNEMENEHDQLQNRSKCLAIDSVAIEPPSSPVSYEYENNFDRSESPPSLELQPEKYSDNECDTNNDDDFDDFHQQSDGLSVNKTDDSISLPSLNLESIRNTPDINKSNENTEEIIDKNKSDETNEEMPMELVNKIDEKSRYADEILDTKLDNFEFARDDETESNLDHQKTMQLEQNFYTFPSTTAFIAEDAANCSNDFCADFSQFASFEIEPAMHCANHIKETDQNAIVDNEDDDFGNFEEANIETNASLTSNAFDEDDDFGEFSDFQQTTTSAISATATATATATVTATATATSTEFQPIVPNTSDDILKPSVDIRVIESKLKSIFETVFPDDDNCAKSGDDDDGKSENHGTNIFINETTIHLKDVENAKALSHQWANSSGKGSLVTALGIDSRNILYGEKWNSSMPRFASNLGFNPLEPIKPVDLAPNQTSSSQPNENHMKTNSFTSTVLKAMPTTDVPAVQFDWNSSGLVNPLDASHAHTLLLDLEQLVVVVANLDKIKLDSSSSSTCNASNYDTMKTSIKPSSSSSSSLSSVTVVDFASLTSTDMNTNTMAKQKYNGDSSTLFCRGRPSASTNTHFGVNNRCDPLTSFDYSTIRYNNGPTNANMNHSKTINNYYHKSLVLDKTTIYQMDQFDPYFNDIRGKEIIHKTNAAENRKSGTVADRKKSIEIAITNDDEFITVEDVLSTTTATASPTPPPPPPPSVTATTASTSTIVSTIDYLNVNDHHQHEGNDDFEPLPTSASYTVPGSSGTLKETHIFTPSKAVVNAAPLPSIVPNEIPSPTTISTNIPYIGVDKPGVGVVINENVVKKEYRDVEYDPRKLKASSVESDDFTEFQSVEPMTNNCIVGKSSISNGILEPIKTTSNISINWPDPGTIVDATVLEDFSSYTSLQIHSKDKQIDKPNELIVNGFASEIENGSHSAPVENAVHFEIEAENSKRTSSKLNDELNDFSEFQSTKTAGIGYIPHVSAIPDIIQTSQSYSLKTVDNHNSIEKQTLSDVFPLDSLHLNEVTAWQHLNGNSLKQMVQPINKNSFIQPVPLINSDILVPQVTSTSSSSLPSQSSFVPPTSKRTPKIEWPEPGINSDELARLETIFPQQSTKTMVTKTSPQKSSHNPEEDDEWSDFVSVTQPQTPITNILNQNLQKHQQNNDDDDWSEFVSSTVPTSQSSQSLANQWAVSSGPNFQSWNAPSQYNSWQNSTIFQTNNSNVPLQSFNSLQSSSQHMIPSTTVGNVNGFASSSTQQSSGQYAPSIISLPDLGFVAPKTLVNMPRATFTKK